MAWTTALAALGLVAGLWLMFTPPGVLGKADAIGFAICHRIDLRSFHLGDRPLPLCARCSGIYLGALFGLGTLAGLGRTRAGGLPPGRVLIALVAGIGLMGLDGVNSYASLFPGLPTLYTPTNGLRLVTGVLTGLALSALLYPVFNQTLWRRWTSAPVVGGFRDLARLWAVGAGLVALMLTEYEAVLWPLAVLSALGVLAVLTVLYTVVVLVVTGRENRAHTWREAAWPMLIGLTLALTQIAVIDLGRYWLFGSWDGFRFPG